jgi:hypothetical protein
MKCAFDLFRLSEELGHIIVIWFSSAPLYVRLLFCQLAFIISTTLLNHGANISSYYLIRSPRPATWIIYINQQVQRRCYNFIGIVLFDPALSYSISQTEQLKNSRLVHQPRSSPQNLFFA